MEEIIEHISNAVRTLPFDLRAEVVIADIIGRGISAETIVMSPKGLMKRKFRRDVESITMKESDTGRKYAMLEVNREGIYDAIPQALIHGGKPGKKGVRKTTKDMVDEVKQIRNEEKAARKFFLPYENEFYHQSVQLEIEEQHILKGYLSSSRYTEFLKDFWQLPSILDSRQRAVFIYLIPIIHKVVGNLQLAQLCYSAVLNVDVRLGMKSGLKQQTNNPSFLNDGKLSLGINFVLGNKLSRGDQYLEIAIGPMTNAQLETYLMGGNGREVINFLNEYYLPLDVEHKIRLIATPEKEEIILLNSNAGAKLGYNSYV